jgi:hypothetical protein
MDADNETSIRAAIQLLVLGDNAGALAILEGMLPDSGDEPVVLIRDAGGA